MADQLPDALKARRGAGHAGAVAVISSHVARGAVGNRAAVLALESLGFPVIAVPTVLLPWHPGHGPATRIIHDEDRFAAFMADLSAGPFASEIMAVLSGYMGSAEQVRIVAETVEALRAGRPELTYVCDPVIGDENGLYVPEAVARAIAEHLIPIADLATPNRFELAWLTGRAVGDNRAVAAAARALPPPGVLVTTAFADRPGRTGNLLVTQVDALVADHEDMGRVPNGTGDLTAALFLGHRLSGRDDKAALERATASVHAILQRTLARGADELTLAPDSDVLTDPPMTVTARPLD